MYIYYNIWIKYKIWKFVKAIKALSAGTPKDSRHDTKSLSMRELHVEMCVPVLGMSHTSMWLYNLSRNEFGHLRKNHILHWHKHFIVADMQHMRKAQINYAQSFHIYAYLSVQQSMTVHNLFAT